MIKGNYEINEFPITMFHTIKVLYDDFDTSLPNNICKGLEKIIINYVSKSINVFSVKL